MKEECLCLLDSKKGDEVAVLVCAQEHERFYPAPPHPTPPHPTPLALFDIDLHVVWQACLDIALLDIDLHVA